MKLPRTWICVLLLAVPAAAQRLSYDEFANTLAQAERLNDVKRYDRAIRENAQHAFTHYRGLVLAALSNPAAHPNDDECRLMRESWERVFGVDTLERFDRWLRTIGQDALVRDGKARQAFNAGYAKLAELTTNNVKERRPYETLRDALVEITQQFESIGNVLTAAETWGLIAQVYIKIPDETVADKKEAVYAIGRFKENREAWNWTKDPDYTQNVNWMKAQRVRIEQAEAAAKKRREEGYGDNVRGAEAFLLPNADALEKTYPLTFEMLAKPKTDMSPQGGPVPMMWANVRMEKTEQQKFQWFKALDLFLLRPSTSRYSVTVDGSEGDVSKKDAAPVAVANRIKKPSLFHLDAEKQRPYAMWFFTGGSQETFQGYAQNLAPTRDLAIIYYKSASSWVADVDGTPVVLYDDNSNGKLFEEDPKEYGLTDRNIGSGPDDEVRIAAYDGMKIGKSPDQPFSNWVSIDGSWFHLRSAKDGTEIGLRPVSPEYFKTGSVKLAWSGPRNAKPEVLVITGRGDFSTARFNIADGKPVEVPVGGYDIAYGRVVQGKGSRMLSANIFGGKSQTFEVAEGKTATVSLGAPFQLDFAREGSGDSVKINSLKMRVYGKSGELYSHINGAAPAPEVVVAKTEDGRGAKVVGEFTSITDGDLANRIADQNTKLGIQVGFYPVVKGDAKGATVLTVDVPNGYKVGLRQNKNKLFGKLVPVFK